MEGQGSSFIPKNSNRVSTVRTRGTHRIYILSYVSYIVFFGTLFAVAGVFLYASSVNRSVVSVKDQLAAERSRFSTDEIESIKLLDMRLKGAEKLVNESAAPSKIFEDLEAVVADNVRFSALEYKYLPSGQFELALTGRAEELNEVIWQQELFKNADVLNDAVVSEYDYSVQGETSESSVSGDATLTFVVTATKSTSLIPYAPDVVSDEEGDITDGEETATESATEIAETEVGTTTVENGT